MMKNKRAFTPITLVFWLIIFVIVFFMFAGQVLIYWSNVAVTSNNLTGVEAFILVNMPLWFILILIISILAYVYIGGSN